MRTAWPWLLLALGVASCTTILGDDFEIVGAPASGGVGGLSTGGGGNEDAGDPFDAGEKDGSTGDGGPSCDPSEEDCLLCEPRTHQCSSAALERCADDGKSWLPVDTCVSAALCDAGTASCLPPVCEPNTYQCSGSQLEVCNSSQDGWTFVAACDSAAHCRAGAGMCLSEPCVAGEFQCSGAELRVCNDTRTDWTLLDTCPSAALCDDDAGTCSSAVCGPGEFSCSGSTLRVCNSTQTGWQEVAACVSSTLCNQTTGMCDPAVCEIGDFNCSGVTLQSCRGDQSGWVDALACASEAHCDAVAGMCRSQPCTAGEYQCSGTSLQRCNATQTGWDDVDSCETPALCDEQQASCNPPACGAGQHQCVGAQLQACNPGRTGYQFAANCSSAQLCDAASGQCDVCVPGAYSCQGAALHRCSTDGQTNPVIQTCASAGHCDAANGRCASSVCPATGRGPSMVQVGTFCIDSTEVTNAQYAAFLASNPSTTSQPQRCGWNTSFAQGRTPLAAEQNWPATYVDWCDAYAFCAWSGKHLCGRINGGPNADADYVDATRSAWYSACTSGGNANYVYPYGPLYSEQTCNGLDNTIFPGMAPAGAATGCHSDISPYNGVYDLSGNAEEWEDSCVQAGGNGQLDYCRLRGGRFTDPAAWLSCDADYGEDRNYQHAAIGFRCCSP